MTISEPLCVFVTLEDSTGHEIDDTLCTPFFRNYGWRLESWAWTQEHPWQQADLLVLRSCYDYWQKPEQFQEFLSQREAEGVRIINPPELVHWNSSKRYLLELEQRGVPIISSLIVDPQSSPEQLFNFLDSYPEETTFVVKPLIGSGGFDMERVSAQELCWDQLCRKEVLLQPFLPTIADGEWSAIYLNGELSHTVLKTAKPGEYRVQDCHGGVTRAARNDEQRSLPEHVEKVRRAMSSLQLPLPCYARYDFLTSGRPGELLLMEVELIEPTLFLKANSNAPQRFVEALLSYS